MQDSFLRIPHEQDFWHLFRKYGLDHRFLSVWVIVFNLPDINYQNPTRVAFYNRSVNFRIVLPAIADQYELHPRIKFKQEGYFIFFVLMAPSSRPPDIPEVNVQVLQ